MTGNALKKSVKEDHETQIQNAPAWKEDQLKWELFKQFLTEQLEDLKEETLMEDALKGISIEENAKSNKGAYKTASALPDIACECDDDYYQDEEFDDNHGYFANGNPGEYLCKLCREKGHAHY